MQSLPECLVLLCEVPEGEKVYTVFAPGDSSVRSIAVRFVIAVVISQRVLANECDTCVYCRLTGHSIRQSATAMSLQIRHRLQSPGSLAG